MWFLGLSKHVDFHAWPAVGDTLKRETKAGEWRWSPRFVATAAEAC